MDRLNELNKEWKEKIDYNLFVEDGILIESDYCKSKWKILFLMKESHKNANWYKILGNPIKVVREYKIAKLWQNIIRWKYLINTIADGNNGDHYPSLCDVQSATCADGNLTDIAYVNVSKELGESTSSMCKLHRTSLINATFLARQLDIISPDIIICAKTYKCYINIYGNINICKLGDHIYSHNGRYIIDFYHPGPPGGNKDRVLYARLHRILMDSKIFDRESTNSL